MTSITDFRMYMYVCMHTCRSSIIIKEEVVNSREHWGTQEELEGEGKIEIVKHNIFMFEILKLFKEENAKYD